MAKFLFKFKSTTNKEDVERLQDVLENNRIYFPKCSQLNDPLEGTGITPFISVAGASIYDVNDEAHAIVCQYKEDFRILSLSEDCFSPQLWAYYCNNYAGVCLCYKSNESFNIAKPVMYNDETCSCDFETMNVEAINEIFKNFFQIKQLGWKSEKEWRIVERTQDTYFRCQPHELLCVIIGHNVADNVKIRLLKKIPKDVKILKTKPGVVSRNINFLPYDYKLVYDGSPPPYISKMEDLEKILNL